MYETKNNFYDKVAATYIIGKSNTKCHSLN